VSAALQVEIFGNWSGTNYGLDHISCLNAFRFFSPLSVPEQCCREIVYISCIHWLFLYECSDIAREGIKKCAPNLAYLFLENGKRF
jgi:hypothetical protein